MSTKDGGELVWGGGEAGSVGFSEGVAAGVFEDEGGAVNQQLEPCVVGDYKGVVAAFGVLTCDWHRLGQA